MVSERNRVLDLSLYLKSLGIKVNVGKNKAFGNKGVFKAVKDVYRIDIAKGQSEESVIRTLAHEFAHYVHYQYDKTLKSLDFIFPDDDEILEDLINITVQTISKQSIKPFFEKKELLENEITTLKNELENLYPNLKLIDYSKKIEQKIKNTSLKYLLKYDKVKVIEAFLPVIYSIETIDAEKDIELYLKLVSKKRALKRINSKIARLNRYYNLPTELFARSFELYISEPLVLKNVSPRIFFTYEQIVSERKIILISDFVEKIK